MVTRRSIYELNKAKDRAHLLEGLSVALFNIDEIIELIKQHLILVKLKMVWSQELGKGLSFKSLLVTEIWHSLSLRVLDSALGLQKNGDYQLSEKQAQAILDLKLHRLTGLEKDKILMNLMSY